MTENELLEIVVACKKVRTYLLGNNGIVRTDHWALSFLKHCKLTHGRLVRWVLMLQEYNINVQYIKGKDNIVSDVLSRVQNNLENNKKNAVWVFNVKTKDIFENINMSN